MKHHTLHFCVDMQMRVAWRIKDFAESDEARETMVAFSD